MIHAIALLVLLWGFSSESGRRLFEPVTVKKEPVQEVTMIFPEQIIPAPLLPKPPPPKAYIRTTQNEGVAVAPKGAAFQSDRNTIAASKLPPKADATLMMPTTAGTAPTKMELANRDYRDGQLKNDNAPPANATPLEMRPPQPAAPPSILKPQQQVPPTPPKQVAKATPADTTPLVKMMEEMDKDAARIDPNRLPIEVRKAEKQKVAETPPPGFGADGPPLVLSETLRERVATLGLQTYYSQSSARTKAEMAPLLEELQRMMENGALRRGPMRRPSGPAEEGSR